MRSKRVTKEEVEYLYEEIGKLKGQCDFENFFEKYLTDREVNDIARRVQLLKLLQEGKTYLEIQRTLKMSPITISRLSIKMGYGGLEEKRKRVKKDLLEEKVKNKPITYKGVQLRKGPTL